MNRKYWFLILFLIGGIASGYAEQRFPPPDFESGYTQPVLTFQEYYSGVRQYLDVALMILALVLAAWLLHAKRNRTGIYFLGLFCLIYFGFYKNGCVCPIGAIQNVTLGVVDSSFPVSFPVILFFILPLVFTLFYGRVFCGAVCPLGAIQDLFLFRPVRVPRWIEGPLGLLRYVYLGLAIYFVLGFNRFVICEYDPFVSFFRLDGPLWRLLLGGLLLVLGLIVARPYCRYLCPYGALLSLLSRWTSVGVRITPDECIKCTLCDAVCPFGAIRRPGESSGASLRFGTLLFILAIILLIGSTGAGYLVLGRNLSGTLLGFWFGIVLAVPLIRLTYTGGRKLYEVDQAACLSCGRCYQWCPHERVRWEIERQHIEE